VESSTDGTKLGVPEEMGTNVQVPIPGTCPHCYPLQPPLVAAPCWQPRKGCGCLSSLAGAGGQSSTAPIPHTRTPLLIEKGHQKESCSIYYTKRTLKTKHPACHSQSLLTPRCPSAERSFSCKYLLLIFKTLLMKVTAAGYCSSPQEKMPSGLPKRPSELRFGLAFLGRDGRDVGSAAEAEVVRG